MSNAARWIVNIPANLLVGLVRIYQVLLSPIFGGRCCFYPSCSETLFSPCASTVRFPDHSAECGEFSAAIRSTRVDTIRREGTATRFRSGRRLIACRSCRGGRHPCRLAVASTDPLGRADGDGRSRCRAGHLNGRCQTFRRAGRCGRIGRRGCRRNEGRHRLDWLRSCKSAGVFGVACGPTLACDSAWSIGIRAGRLSVDGPWAFGTTCNSPAGLVVVTDCDSAAFESLAACSNEGANSRLPSPWRRPCGTLRRASGRSHWQSRGHARRSKR